MIESPQFTVVLRGYDPKAVDQLVAQIAAASAASDPGLRAAVREAALAPELRMKFRGYDRTEVAAYLSEAAASL